MQKMDEPRYRNRLPPEGINITDEHPLKEFSSLLIASLLIVITLVTVLSFASTLLTPLIPFEYEVKLANSISDKLNLKNDSDNQSTLDKERQAYLESLLQKLLAATPVPNDISITVHYSNNPEPNAMATLGGNIIVYGGLFEHLKTENALAFVLAHEIAHIAHRDPIKALGRGLLVSLALTALLGANDSGVPDWIVSQTGNITALSFSRSQEASADDYALQNIFANYEHMNGADELFIFLQQEKFSNLIPEFYRTHPLNEKRIKNIHNKMQATPEKEIQLIPLPQAVIESTE